VLIDNATRTLRAQALSILRDELISGRLRPGDRVNEVQIATEMGISRGTLREAIRNLEQEGLLVSIPHRGTSVRRLTVAEAAELQEVRLSLEVTAAIRVSRAWTPAVEAILEDRLDVLAHAYTTPLPFPERLRADLGFHGAICESCGNRTLLDVWRSLVGHVTVMVLHVGPARMTQLQDPDAHRPLLEAIASANERTIRRVFTRHFDEGQRVVAAAFEAADVTTRRDGV
jgi:DNA-binding GntR family transcriptional regulator